MSYDSWDFEPAPAPEVDAWDTWDTGGSSAPGNLDLSPPVSDFSFGGGPPPFGSDGKGCFDMGKGDFGGKGFVAPSDFGGKGLVAPSDFGGKGLVAPSNFNGCKGDFGKGPNDFGKGPNAFGKGVDSFDNGKGCFDIGKGGGDGMNFGGPGNFVPDFGKGSPDFMKGGPDFGKGFPDMGKGPMNLDFGKGGCDFGKGGCDFGKGGCDFGKGNGLSDIGKGCGKDFSKGMFDVNKGCGKGDFGFKGQDNFSLKGGLGKNDFSGMDGGFTPMGMPNQGMKGSFDGKGMVVLPPGAAAKAQNSGQFVPPPQMPFQPMNKGMKGFDGGKGFMPAMKGMAPGLKGAPMGMGLQPMGGVVPPPPPGAFVPNGNLMPFAKAPQGGMMPDMLALAEAEMPDEPGLIKAMPANDKKPRLIMLLTRLSPDLKSEHLQQLLDQCGDVQSFRRARDPNGKPLSFGFAQFADPEAAWKAHTCISKLVLCELEIKVLLEEHTEKVIQQWRDAQQAALKVTSNEELEWELERKSVSCKASIDAKIEELYGTSKGGGASSKRREELRKKEQARILRLRKRKAWREGEFAKELAQVESLQKRLRREERERDGIDRKKEALSAPKVHQEASDLMTAKKEELNESGGSLEAVGTLAVANDNRVLHDLVDRIQSEPRERIYKLDLDMSHHRNEKTFEKKLRPWLERKIDRAMGGPQSDLVEYVLRRVNADITASSLISDLQRYMDDNAEPLVERLWRMLIFEQMRCGLPMDGYKRDKKQERA